MGKLIVTTNMTLDGVVQDPDGKEGFHLGGWFENYGAADLAAWAQLEAEEALAAEALVLGRNTDAWFATRWTGREGRWAEKLNSMPKYVVSQTLTEAQWSNASVMSGDLAPQIVNLKNDTAGDIVVYASYQLVRALLQAGLVDELRLVIFPVVLGGGLTLFSRPSETQPLKLLGTRTIGSGLGLVNYEVLPQQG